MKNKWSEITVNEFVQLEQILKSEIPESYRTVNVVALLSNQSIDEIENLPISTFIRLSKQLDFIHTDPKYKDIEKSYKINENIYNLRADIAEITTAQYIDYQNYMKEENKDMCKLLSVWLIPEGHNYNDGYDMQQVINDCGYLLLQDALGIAFFFKKQLAAYILITQQSLIQNLKILMKENPKIKKKKVKELETHLNNLASQYWYSPYAKERTLRSKR